MNRISGYALAGIGLLGVLFFSKYKGTIIPLKNLWLVLSIFTVIVGFYFYARYKLQRLNNQRTNSNRLAEIEQLKRSGDKVRITLENAEVKSRSYKEEIIDEGLPSRIEIIDALYDDNRNYKTHEIRQTYIVFYKQYDGKMHKFISQATTQNADAVKRYINRQKGIDLYIDPKKPTNYYFELPYV